MFEMKPAEEKGPLKVIKGGALIDGNGGIKGIFGNRPVGAFAGLCGNGQDQNGFDRIRSGADLGFGFKIPGV